MVYEYSRTDYSKDHMSRAVGLSLPISTKHSVELCNSIRQKQLGFAKTMLRNIVTLRKPIEFSRFTHGAGHKKGIGAGKYPVKAAEVILGLLENAESNAQFKGLNTSSLKIIHISAQKAGNVWRYGRHRRRKMKRTNIEVVLREAKEAKKEPKEKLMESKSVHDKKHMEKQAPEKNQVTAKAVPEHKPVSTNPSPEKHTQPKPVIQKPVEKKAVPVMKPTPVQAPAEKKEVTLKK